MFSIYLTCSQQVTCFYIHYIWHILLQWGDMSCPLSFCFMIFVTHLWLCKYSCTKELMSWPVTIPETLEFTRFFFPIISLTMLIAIRKKKIFLKIKEKVKHIRYGRMVIDSLMTKLLWSHLCENKLNELKIPMHMA